MREKSYEGKLPKEILKGPKAICKLCKKEVKDLLFIFCIMQRRIAVIDKEKCNPIACGDFLCIRMCPLNRAGKEAIVKGPDGKAQINEDIATDACQVCVNI